MDGELWLEQEDIDRLVNKISEIEYTAVYLENRKTVRIREEHDHDDIAEVTMSTELPMGQIIVAVGICLDCKKQLYGERKAVSVEWLFGKTLRFIDKDGNIIKEKEIL